MLPCEGAGKESMDTTEGADVETVPPPNSLKIDALRRLKALDRRGKTVGNHLDELRALLTVLFELLPD